MTTRSFLLLAMGGLLGLACGQTDTIAERDDAEFAAGDQFVTREVFGEVDPLLEVARCGDRRIVVADVAYWLEFYPVLTVEQAVDDLLDLCVVNAAVDPSRFATWDDYRRDAQLLARATTWLRHTIVMDESITVDPAEVASYVDSVENTTFFGTPELVTVSHVVVLVSEDAEASARGIARDVASSIASDLRTLPSPVEPADIARSVAAHRSAADGVGLQVSVEPRLRFPRVYSGESTWGSLSAVVEPFAVAAFTTPVGGVFGPIETSYGWHAGVVEDREPAQLVPAEERPLMIERNLLTAAQRTVFDQRLRVIYEATDISIDPEAVNVLAGNSLDRIAGSNRR